MEIYFSEKLANYSSFESIVQVILNNRLEQVIQNVKAITRAKKKKRSVDTDLLRQRIKEKVTNEGMDKPRRIVRMDEKEIKSLLKKLQKEKEARHEKLRLEQEKINKKIAEEIEIQKIQASKFKELVHEESLKKIQELKELTYRQKSQRMMELDNRNRELKKVSSVKPLFRKIEERYVTSYEIPEYEKRKKELEKKKLQIVPIDPKEIAFHQQNYNKLLEEQDQKRKNKAKELQTDLKINSSLTNLFKAKIFEIVKSSEKKLQEMEEQKIETRRKLAEKSKNYGALVTELFKPIINVKESLKTFDSQTKLSKIKSSKRNINLESQGLLLHPPEIKKSAYTSRAKRTNTAANRLKRKLSTSNSPKKQQYFDYLANQRKLRADQYKPKADKRKSWQDIIDDQSLTPRNKIKKLKHELDKLDIQTKSYENLNGISNSLVLSENISKSYLDSIKVKLAYINELGNI